MFTLSCPYCYDEIDGARLWYRCLGRGAPGRIGCPADRDEDRFNETGFTQAVRPSYPPSATRGPVPRKAACPDCGGVSGIRVCPCCHTPLPAHFGDASSPLIAMVGAKGTGKSVYLTVLAHELRSTIRRRFDADVRLTGDAQAGFESPLQWLDQNVERIFKRHELPEQTPRNQDPGRREPLVFEWRWRERRPGRPSRYRSSYLSFYDTAGEQLDRQEEVHDLAYLGSANALILLLDPFMLPRAVDELQLPERARTSDQPTIDVVNRVTETLKSSHAVEPNALITIPVAVVFAKIDAFFRHLGEDHPLRQTPPPVPAYDDNAGNTAHEHVRALLDKFGADDIDAHFRHHYQTFRYFAVSALGTPPDYANAKVEPGGVRPHRVDEPLVWLLSRFRVVPTQRRR